MYLDKPGVYKITNTINGKFYIGSSINLRKRRNRHMSQLNLGTHYNIHLQRAAIKYGMSSFIFSVLIICEERDLYYYEQVIIDKYKPSYNIRKIVESNKGVRKSDAEKKRVGNQFRGKVLSAEHKFNRDKSRILNSIERNSLSGIQRLPSGKYRVKLAKKHLGCFSTIDDAYKFRIDYINSLFGGG